MTTKKAMDHLRKALREDHEYFYGWQANIAMSFYDEMEKRGYKLPDLHVIANNAARRFLTNLVKEEDTDAR